MCMVASSSRDLAHTAARSASLISRPPRAPTYDQQLCPQVVYAACRGVPKIRGTVPMDRRDPRRTAAAAVVVHSLWAVLGRRSANGWVAGALGLAGRAAGLTGGQRCAYR